VSDIGGLLVVNEHPDFLPQLVRSDASPFANWASLIGKIDRLDVLVHAASPVVAGYSASITTHDGGTSTDVRTGFDPTYSPPTTHLWITVFVAAIRWASTRTFVPSGHVW
jgi:hypothetical protein